MESKKTLLVSGCSFTFEPWNWPTFVANEFDYDLINVAMGCQGNGLIFRKLIYKLDELLKTKSPEDIIVGVMWSGIDRVEFHMKDVKFPANYDGWKENPTCVIPGINTWVIGNHHWTNKYSKLWYVTYYSDIEMAIKTMEYIIFTQMYLEKHRIKYFMSTYMDIFHSKYSEHITYSKEVKYLYDMIDFSKFLPVSGCHEWVKEHYNDGGFNNPDEHGNIGVHPTEFGHKMFSDEVIVPFIKKNINNE